MEVYIDDMLVKSKKKSNHIADMRQTFKILKEHQMKPNLKKCVFEVDSSKFLDFLVN